MNLYFEKYNNLQNFDESQLKEYNFMFGNVPDNVVICINISYTKILSGLTNKTCYNIDCINDWKSRQKK